MHNIKTIERKYLVPFLLVTSLFLLWGLANNMTDTLLAAFKNIMDMSDTETSLIQFAFYGSYFCFALPAALYIRKKSYKSGIILGLFMYAIGAMLFFPAAMVESYIFYLVASSWPSSVVQCSLPIQGIISDATSINTSYLVPAVCFVVVLLYALYSIRNKA